MICFYIQWSDINLQILIWYIPSVYDLTHLFRWWSDNYIELMIWHISIVEILTHFYNQTHTYGWWCDTFLYLMIWHISTVDDLTNISDNTVIIAPEPPVHSPTTCNLASLMSVWNLWRGIRGGGGNTKKLWSWYT